MGNFLDPSFRSVELRLNFLPQMPLNNGHWCEIRGIESAIPAVARDPHVVRPLLPP